jgi:hypothetical protein
MIKIAPSDTTSKLSAVKTAASDTKGALRGLGFPTRVRLCFAALAAVLTAELSVGGASPLAIVRNVGL